MPNSKIQPSQDTPECTQSHKPLFTTQAGLHSHYSTLETQCRALLFSSCRQWREGRRKMTDRTQLKSPPSSSGGTHSQSSRTNTADQNFLFLNANKGMQLLETIKLFFLTAHKSLNYLPPEARAASCNILGVVRKTLDSSRKIKLTHFLTQTAIHHV